MDALIALHYISTIYEGYQVNTSSHKARQNDHD